ATNNFPGFRIIDITIVWNRFTKYRLIRKKSAKYFSVRYDFWDRRCEERSDEAIQWPEFVEVAH
ncbi:hypothetical protein, partial [Escherichia coli]|uniref:hypothetical protein n=1 Tax=Escherichia coli TaxID=562 RepID=UPI001A7ED434